MRYRINNTVVLCACAASFFAMSSVGHCAEGDSDIQKEVEQLRHENKALLDRVQAQDNLIENLGRRISNVEQTSSHPSQDRNGALSDGNSPVPATHDSSGLSFGKINISGEGGVAFFDNGKNGAFPNSEFRVDEAKLFIESPVWEDVYFFNELNLTLRESPNESTSVGELYIDFENVSQLWGREGQLNVRIGRMDIPFGHEYQTRDAILNPLISHSLSDTWGVDEGVELYGRIGKFNYVFAVQNGSHPSLRDYTSDKAVVGRIGFSPTDWLEASVSGMRTGASDVPSYEMTELWFGNGFIRALGAMTNTSLSHAELVELDLRAHWTRGHIATAGGYIHFDDNDTTTNNRRDVYYYYVEGVQGLTRKLYVATRWSQILAERGFPVVGYESFRPYFTDNAELVSNIWRLSLGLGYDWSKQLRFKVEYGMERGKKVAGVNRDEHFVASEVAFKF